MAIYQINNTKKKMINKQHIQRVFLIIALCLLVGLLPILFQAGDTKVLIILITLLISFIPIAVGIKLGSKIHKENHLDISVIIENQRVSLVKNGVEIINKGKEDIIKIEHYPNSSMIIFLNSHPNKILLNSNIDNYESLKNELNQIHEINDVDKNPSNILVLSSLALILILYSIFNFSSNNYLIILSGIMLTLSLIISFIKLFFDKYTDKRIKVASLGIFFVLYSVITQLISFL